MPILERKPGALRNGAPFKDWKLPNRRFIDSGLYLPSMRTEGMGTLAVIIDTSGSVDTDVLAAFWSEVREVAAEIEPERVVVLQVDAAVQDEVDYAERSRVGGPCWPTGATGPQGRPVPVQDRFLKRQLSFPVSMISQWWVRRSSRAVVILGSPKTEGHSPKARFVVMTVDVLS